jgi:thiosulfate/3-mercaptopyruvate sulfurtransferase
VERKTLIKIIDPSWLQKHLSDPSVVTVDPRPVVKYLEGHIPRAVNLPLAKLLDPKSLALMPPQHLSEIFGQAGIDQNATAVLYDTYDGQNAAMVAWVLEYLGHPHVTILSCRLEGWVNQGLEVLYKPVIPGGKKFDAKPNNGVRAISEELLQGENGKLLDLRSREEFQGKVATEVRTGHIPGAINIPWTDLIGYGNEFLRSRPELEEVGKRVGPSPTSKVVTYCSYGPRAAIGYVALQHLGYSNVRVYDGSFHQWAQHSQLPIEGEGLQLQF